MATSRQLHRFKNVNPIFLFLILISLLLLALPAATQDSSSSSSQATTQQTTPPSTGGIKANPGKDKGITPVPESKPDFWHQQYLLGDWGGARTKLAEEKGVTFDFFYVTDMLDATSARIKTGGAAWNRVRGTMDIDFGKLAGVKGLFFHVTGLWQGGPNLGADYLGSISNPSGLVSARTEILDSYWLEYDMLDQKVAFRFGQFASMDIYGLQPYGGAFLMEPIDYGFNNRFNDYASFDPASGPGVQIQVKPVPWMYFKGAYTSGNRNPYVQDPNGFHFVKANSGVLSDEIGFVHDQNPASTPAGKKRYPGQYAFGSTYNGGKFANPFCDPLSQVPGCPPVGSEYYTNPLFYSTYTGNYVMYLMANQAIYRHTPGSNRGLDALFGIAWSPNQTYNFVDKNILAGLVYNGPITSRPRDSIAFGLSYSHVSDKYAATYLAVSPLGTAPYGSETAYEVNYLFQATPFWMIQPTVQWYQNVGGFSRAGTGAVFGFRTKVDF
jgi:porin